MNLNVYIYKLKLATFSVKTIKTKRSVIKFSSYLKLLN